MRGIQSLAAVLVVSSVVIGVQTQSALAKSAEKSTTSSMNRYFQPAHFHLLPDASGIEHQEYFNIQKLKLPYLDKDGKDKKNELLEVVVTAGERNLDWLKLINSKRDADKKLSFTSPETRQGYPIDKANKYSPALIHTKFENFINNAPEEFAAVVLGSKNMSSEVPVELKEYLRLGLEMDRLYQSATRWTLLEPYLNEMAANRAWDIRGHYFLNQIADLKNQLENFKNLPVQTQDQYRDWLISVCMNNDRPQTACNTELNQNLDMPGKNAYKFFTKYAGEAKERYDSFFQVPNSAKRKDITWNKANEQLATIPFLEPEPAVKEFMLNVEDEWQWNGWQLKLNFKKSGFGIPHIVFIPGITPNVDRLGGNKISMDSNTPLTEWEPGWTIRHEFGHVLGFPDCYVEFYDEANSVMINYQIDVKNLMCSRVGNLVEHHYSEMKRVYFKP